MGIYTKIKNTYSDGTDRFIVITVATDRNENLDRFEESCVINGIPYIILGLGDKWESGRAENGVLLEPGGAQKIIYLRDEISKWVDLENTIILFSDSYDVIFNDTPDSIIRKFRDFKHPIVFSAEKTCWPKKELSEKYPNVDSEYKFLNSGGFIGYGNHIKDMIDIDINKSDDDQEYYTNYYLNHDKPVIAEGNDYGEFENEILKYFRDEYSSDNVLCDLNPLNGKYGLILGSHFKYITSLSSEFNNKFIYDEVVDTVDELIRKPDVLFVYDIRYENIDLYEGLSNKFKEVVLVVDFNEDEFSGDSIEELLPSYKLKNWSNVKNNGWLVKRNNQNVKNSEIVLDHNQNIFQTLNMAIDDVKVSDNKIYNVMTKTNPSIIHGNGSSNVKDKLGELYDELYVNEKVNSGDYKLLFNIFLDFDVLDIDQVFDQIRYLNYPKENVTIQIFFDDTKHEYKVNRFIEKFKGQYKDIQTHLSNGVKSDRRNKSLLESMKYDVDYVINFDCNYVFRNRDSIKDLISEDRNIISPMIVSEGTDWVNFWFRTDSDGYSIDNEHQDKIRNYDMKDTYSVGFVTGIIMFKSSVIPDLIGLYVKGKTDYSDDDFDISFCREVIRRGYQIWVTNKNYYGGVI